MDTITDEDVELKREWLIEHIEQSSPEEIFEELKNNSNCLHQAKEVCNNARISLPKAIEQLNQAMSSPGLTYGASGPIREALERVKATLASMKDVPEMVITESHVVKYMKDYAAENEIEHVSIQFTAKDKEFPNSRDNLFFYCNNRGHSGSSTRSIAEANGRLDLEMSRLGAKV